VGGGVRVAVRAAQRLETMLSITPSFIRSRLVSFRLSASWAEPEPSLNRIALHASGLMTEYQANSIMATLSATPMPSAPPDPPSPQTTEDDRRPQPAHFHEVPRD
jgi:hypothetical protein